MLGLPGTWQAGRSGPTSATYGSAFGSLDHPGAESPAGGVSFERAGHPL